MAPYPIHGFTVKHSLAKSVYKGEDSWVQQRDVEWKAGEHTGNVSFDVFGVFDGHGGKQAATYASRHVVAKMLEAAAEAHLAPELQPGSPGNADSGASELAGASPDEAAAWQAQDALAAALPRALASAFQRVQAEFNEHHQTSGTTATVAAVVGWQLVVANVGDSLAYVDTGSEVVQVSGNHRLDDSRAERERCKAVEGVEVAATRLEGKPVGPLRVWPGGLAMSRTIGDAAAGEVVTAEPEVRAVLLPASGGRLIIASDGLWDAMQPKTAAHHIRGMPASRAANELVQAALKARGLRDDITVLVVDALPEPDTKVPPLLARRPEGHGAAAHAYALALEALEPLALHRPLEEHDPVAWLRPAWARRRDALAQRLAPATPPLTEDEAHATWSYSEDGTTPTAEGSQEGAALRDSADSSLDASSWHVSVAETEPAGEWETVPSKRKPASAASSPTAADALAAEAPSEPDAASRGPQAPPSWQQQDHIGAGTGEGGRGAGRGRGQWRGRHAGGRGRGRGRGGRGATAASGPAGRDMASDTGNMPEQGSGQSGAAGGQPGGASLQAVPSQQGAPYQHERARSRGSIRKQRRPADYGIAGRLSDAPQDVPPQGQQQQQQGAGQGGTHFAGEQGQQQHQRGHQGRGLHHMPRQQRGGAPPQQGQEVGAATAALGSGEPQGGFGYRGRGFQHQQGPPRRPAFRGPGGGRGGRRGGPGAGDLVAVGHEGPGGELGQAPPGARPEAGRGGAGRGRGPGRPRHYSRSGRGPQAPAAGGGAGQAPADVAAAAKAPAA